MRLAIETRLSYATKQPCDVLLQIEVAHGGAQNITSERMVLDAGSTARPLDGEEGISTRKWIAAGADFTCDYTVEVEIDRTKADLLRLEQTPWAQIPADVVKYLMPSRYCHPELFLDFVSSTFGTLTHGAQIAAMRDWITQNFTYDPNASHAGTTVIDSFAAQAGVCRDYAHMLITLARAAGVPARFISVYAPDVKPQDFHAVAEVYLSGAWHIVDATGMADPTECARICVGRDAADASFLTSYGWIELKEQTVNVRRI